MFIWVQFTRRRCSLLKGGEPWLREVLVREMLVLYGGAIIRKPFKNWVVLCLIWEFHPPSSDLQCVCVCVSSASPRCFQSWGFKGTDTSTLGVYWLLTIFSARRSFISAHWSGTLTTSCLSCSTEQVVRVFIIKVNSILIYDRLPVLWDQPMFTFWHISIYT